MPYPQCFTSYNDHSIHLGISWATNSQQAGNLIAFSVPSQQANDLSYDGIIQSTMLNATGLKDQEPFTCMKFSDTKSTGAWKSVMAI